MRKIISVILLAVAVFTFAFGSPALAADATKGASIFKANCASCHANGKNLVNAQKTLKKEALEKYGMYSMEAIVKQVTYGKNAMPAFRGRLSAEKIQNVSAYVLAQADKGWKK